MNEEQLKRILVVDQELQQSYEAARETAELIPIQAKDRVDALLLKSKENAEAEAILLIIDARQEVVNKTKAEILESEILGMERLGKKNLVKAIQFVNQWILGAITADE